MTARKLTLVAVQSEPLPKPYLFGEGYRLHYRQGQTNHCPGCGGTSWSVGRFSAQCGGCATALPLAEGAVR